MSATNTHENAVLNHLLNNANIAGIGDAAGLLASAADGSLFLRAFTADPGETGSIAAEATYGGYAAEAISRDGTRWAVAAGSGSNAFEETLPEATSGSNVLTYVALASAATGSTLLVTGALAASLTVTTGITPTFQIGTIVLSLD